MSYLRYLIIDPGHGGDDPGAIGPTGLRECDVNQALAFHLHEAVIADHYLDLEPRLLRVADTTMSLAARTTIANQLHVTDAGVAAYLSLHCNAYHSQVAEGFEVWTSPGVTFADSLATFIWRWFRQGFPDRRPRLDMCDGDPDKESRFWVLVHTAMPAVLVESAFITNPLEESLLRDDWYLSRVAAAIVQALGEYQEWLNLPA